MRKAINLVALRWPIVEAIEKMQRRSCSGWGLKAGSREEEEKMDGRDRRNEIAVREDETKVYWGSPGVVGASCFSSSVVNSAGTTNLEMWWYRGG